MDDVKRDEQKHRVFNENDIMPVLEEILQSGGECRLVVTGYSMVPTLKHKRDSVILISPEHRKIKKGEIVLIKRKSGKYILHRIYQLKGEYIILNGDAQLWCEVINTSQIIGVVKTIIRKNKAISCDNAIYKFYVYLWMAIRPFRGAVFKIRGKLKGAKSDE